MALNQCKFNVLLVIFTILGACITTGISLAEDQPAGEVITKTPSAPVEASATVWDKTKDGSARAWRKTKEVSSDVWDATKEGSARAWDKTKSTVQGWQETKPESETNSNQETPAPSQSP